MKRVLLLALSLMLSGIWSHGGAKAQNSVAPPVQLTPPDASPARAGARTSRQPPQASSREVSPPAGGGLPPAPNSAADYDGFSADTGDSNAPSQVTPPARPRSANSVKTNGDKNDIAGQLIDQEDEALKQKLTICKNCK